MTFIITECPEHGTKEVSDMQSMRVYVIAALSCLHLHILTPAQHDAEHAYFGEACWACCDKMVVDPSNLC